MDWIVVKSSIGYLVLASFCEKITCCAWLIGSVMKLIFYLWGLIVKFLSWITKKRDVSSANNLRFEDKSSDKSLIDIFEDKTLTNGRSLRDSSWDISRRWSLIIQDNVLLIIFRKLFKSWKRSPYKPYWLNLKICRAAPCQTSAFDMSRSTPPTSKT